MMAFNPLDYTTGAKVLGIALMILGAALLIFSATLFLRKKRECNCDD